MNDERDDERTTVDALRLVEEFARSTIRLPLDNLFQEASKSAGELSLASELTEDERVALFYALYAVVDAISKAANRGYEIANLEVKTLEESSRLKDEALTNRVRSAFVEIVCLLVVGAALYYREGDVAATAFLIFILFAAPKAFDKFVALASKLK